MKHSCIYGVDKNLNIEREDTVCPPKPWWVIMIFMEYKCFRILCESDALLWEGIGIQSDSFVIFIFSVFFVFFHGEAHHSSLKHYPTRKLQILFHILCTIHMFWQWLDTFMYILLLRWLFCIVQDKKKVFNVLHCT